MIQNPKSKFKVITEILNEKYGLINNKPEYLKVMLEALPNCDRNEIIKPLLDKVYDSRNLESFTILLNSYTGLTKDDDLYIKLVSKLKRDQEYVLKISFYALVPEFIRILESSVMKSDKVVKSILSFQPSMTSAQPETITKIDHASCSLKYKTPHLG